MGTKILFSRKTKKLLKKWGKKFFSIFFWTGILAILLFLAIEGYAEWKNFSQKIENISEENKILSEKFSGLEKKNFSLCMEHNTTRKMMMMPEFFCGEENSTKNSERIFSLEEDILTFFQKEYISPQQDFPKNIIIENSDENSDKDKYKYKDLNIGKNIKKFPEQKKSWDNFFQNIKKNTEKNTESEIKISPEIFAYMLSYGVEITKIQTDTEKFFLLKKTGKPDIKIYWESQKTFLVAEKIIEKKSEKEIISGITEKYRNFQASHQEKFSEEEFLSIKNQKIPEISEHSNTNMYLLVGTNEGNTDTMILSFVNKNTQKITLISLPRDIWYQGKKLNRILPLLGHSAFIRAIEKITQKKISGYTIISMDIFPEIIDSMGGIDFEFSQPLIDPSYKTIDNGKKGTLFFSKGTHHLSGIQALRVVRSRFTTNDFSRGKRQQQLLEAIREQSREKNFSELLSLAKIILSNTKTNLTPFEMVQLYLASKKYKIQTGTVISTQNILFSKMLPVGNNLKAYILLPKNNNWDLIPKFIQKKLEEK